MEKQTFTIEELTEVADQNLFQFNCMECGETSEWTENIDRVMGLNRLHRIESPICAEKKAERLSQFQSSDETPIFYGN